MNESYEVVVSHTPFTVRRTVRWADCDPACVVYAGRFTDYLLGAVSLFCRHIGWGPETDRKDGVGLPCKHMALTFHVGLPPGAVVNIQVRVGEIRNRTFDLLAHAYLPDGQLAFEGMFTPICTVANERRSTLIPPALRDALQAHLLSEGKEEPHEI